MTAMWLILVALLEVASVSSASSKSSPLSRGRASNEDATAAVLTATGGSYLHATTPDLTIPTCLAPCNDYMSGATADGEEPVCIDALGSCSPSGCGDSICMQTFHNTCNSECSEWGDSTETTQNVCQPTAAADRYKCLGKDTCDSGEYKCRQKPIEECWLFCEGYHKSGGEAASVDEDSELVCQNLDSNNKAELGECYTLPCNSRHQSSSTSLPPKVCRQSTHDCVQPCSAGSEVLATGSTSMCQDTYTYHCSNQKTCAGNTSHVLERCRPTFVHQDLTLQDKSASSWTTNLMEEEKGELVNALQEGGKEYQEDLVGAQLPLQPGQHRRPQGQPVNQAKISRDAQQRVRIEALKKKQHEVIGSFIEAFARKAATRRDGPEKGE